MKYLSLVIVIAAASGCIGTWSPSVAGSGVSKSKKFEVAEFSRIETNGAFDVEVRQGDKQTLEVVGDDNLLELVNVENEGGRVSVGFKENYSSKIGMRIVATMRTVEGVKVNGSGNVDVRGVSGESLELAINGSGEMKATGKVEKMNASISGSGNIDATDVESKTASASIAGSGAIGVFAVDTLDASVSGSGEVRYKGSPKVSKSIHGSGSVEPK